MSDYFVGQIVVFGCNFAPTGFAFCRGQLLNISQNTALFALLGTYYGGNGQTNFALPNLQGKVPVGFGQGAGLTNRDLGETGGAETVALTTTQMPGHTHSLTVGAVIATAACRNDTGNRQTPVGNVPAVESAGVTATYGSAPNAAMRDGNVTLTGPATTAVAGAALAHENRQPFLALNYCIALQGVFPPHP